MLGRVLIYGASRDTAVLRTILAAVGADVDFVHPTSVADDLGTDFPAAVAGHRVAEPCDVPSRPFEYDAVFVDTSYDEILPPDKLWCSVEAKRAGALVSCVADYVLAGSNALTIGVTGSAGKTTTASLIAHILRTAGRTVHIATDPRPQTNRCPNYEVLLALPEMAPTDVLVAELTSVCLSYMQTSPDIAVVTNLWPEHVEWHGSMAAYVSAKQNILRYQGADDWAVLNGDDPEVQQHFARRCGSRLAFFGREDPHHPYCVFLSANAVRVRWDDYEEEVALGRELHAEEPHVLNMLAAVAVAKAAGSENAALAEALSSFPGVTQRRELVGEVRGVRVFNDGMAMSPVKVRRSLESFAYGSVLLIAGGDATLPNEVLHSSLQARAQLEQLAETIARRTRTVVLYGEGGRILRSVLLGRQTDGVELLEVADLSAATSIAAARARAGTVLLFAPLFYVPPEDRSQMGERLLRELMLLDH